MKHFKSSKEAYDAGYALPSYSISRTKRLWTYYDKKYETPPVGIEIETVLLGNTQIGVLPCEALNKTA